LCAAALGLSLGLKTKALISICAALRPGPLTSTSAAAKTSLRILARRWQQLQAELTQLDAQLQTLVTAAAPTLLALPGVGVDTAGQLLVTAGDNPQRLRSEAAFAHLCGVSPIPASSGRTDRPGSIVAATAEPTTPCGASPWSACAATHRPGPMSSGAPNKACPSSTSCVVGSATSPARSTSTSRARTLSPYHLPGIGGINEPHRHGHNGAARWHASRPARRIGRAGY
jgi:Transposase IS116/IS110/IS902 family